MSSSRSQPPASRRPTREPRDPLTRDRVLAGALRLADEEGIEALTMRRLAQSLGVEAMTPYYHIGSKEAMLDALVDAVTAEFVLPPDGADWRTAIRTLALSAYDALSRHPWAASLTLSLRRPSPGRLRYMDAILGILADAGFSPDLVDRGYHAIEGHIMGFTLWEVGMAIGNREDLERLATNLLQDLDGEAYPHVVKHVEDHLQRVSSDEVGAFAFGLEHILDGLERLRP